MKILPLWRTCPEAVNNNVGISQHHHHHGHHRYPHTMSPIPPLCHTVNVCVGQTNMQQLGPWLANTKKHSHPEIPHTCARPLDGTPPLRSPLVLDRTYLLQPCCSTLCTINPSRAVLYILHIWPQPWKRSEPNPVFSSAASRSPNKNRQPEQA